MAGPPPDVLTIAGTPVDLAATSTALDRLTTFRRGGVPSLEFSRLLRTPAVFPDPWNLRPCTLTMRGLQLFGGWVTGYIDRYSRGIGWVREYRALGLQYMGNYVPVTDSQSLTDTSIWNLPGTDANFIGSRAGQSVGHIVGAILTMANNAANLAAWGIGAYTSLNPPTLPAATLADLAGLAVIPPGTIRVAGERILAALESLVQQFHPNHFLYVEPDGTVRFLDPRTFAAVTVTLNGADPRWTMPTLTRDASENYSQVEVRGFTLVRAVTLQDKPWPGSSLPDGGLQEWFAHDNLTEAQAKAQWLPSDWSQPNTGMGSPLDSGTCSETDSTHVVISTTHTYAADQLAQGSGQLLGWVNLIADSLNGHVNQYWLARVIANTATSGGQCTLTIDTPVPALTYNAYQLYGLAAGENVVGRRYRVTNAAIAHSLQNAFPYPVALPIASASLAEMVSSPLGLVWYSPVGASTPPYNVTSVGVTVDPDGGLVYFDNPVQFVAGGFTVPVRWPAVVQAFLAVGVGTLNAFAPHTGFGPTYGGTLYTEEGIERTKVITVLDWRDLGNQANMETFAAETFDSLKDVFVEGSLPYMGLPDAGWLLPGQSASITGNGYQTGWESLALPTVAVEVAFQHDAQGTSYVTILHLSNRRMPYNAGNFLRPNLTGAWVGSQLPETGFGAPPPTAEGIFAAQVLFQKTRQQNVEGTVKLAWETLAQRMGGRPGGFTGQVVGPEAAMAGMVGQAGAVAGGLGAAADMAAGGFGQQAAVAAGTLGRQAALAGAPVMAGPAGVGEMPAQGRYRSSRERGQRARAARRALIRQAGLDPRRLLSPAGDVARQILQARAEGNAQARNARLRAVGRRRREGELAYGGAFSGEPATARAEAPADVRDRTARQEQAQRDFERTQALRETMTGGD